MRLLSTCFHPCVFAAYPLLVVVGANAGVVPLEGAVIARCLAAAIGIAVLLLLMLRPLVRDLATRAALLSFVFIGFSVYTFVGGASMNAGLASLYAVACVAGSTLIVRPWTGRPRTSTVVRYPISASYRPSPRCSPKSSRRRAPPSSFSTRLP